MQDNNREMHVIDAELYFVIDENNSVELTEKGVEYLSESVQDKGFVLPDIGTEIAKIEGEGLSSEDEAAKKEVLFKDFGVKSERIHTMTQLFKAYTLLKKTPNTWSWTIR